MKFCFGVQSLQPIFKGTTIHDIPGSSKRVHCMFTYIIQGIAFGFAAAVTPGPLFMFLVSQAVTAGWRRTLPAAFAPLISDGPIMVLVLAILSQVPSQAIHYLRFPGGAFILHLAFEAWKEWRSFDSRISIPPPINQRSLWKAAVVNWLNPNVYLGWSLMLGPTVLGGWHESPARGIVFLVGFYATIVATMMAIIIVFAAARNLGPKVRKTLIGLSSVTLAVLGLYQLWLGIFP
jgi:threonine/homoserine/homoserine lactone efflux protein